LESGRVVYMGFADRNFPDANVRREFAYRQMIVFRERDQMLDGAGGGRFVLLTGWQGLPNGISFASGFPSIVNLNQGGVGLEIDMADGIPRMPSGGTLPVIEWNEAGMIVQPEPSALNLFLYEGFFLSELGTDQMTRPARGAGQDLWDQIRLGPFTGKGRLVVSTLQ